ncbi:MAG: hypothetical protein KZQ78_14855 [Candidatus Thiodiazotropha sp. (ex Ustalcina ferruginea)]|nr:hypothetical protein [Candidatus Thiodiazotropha sp. (ex Ustalcina ferruginea)]
MGRLPRDIESPHLQVHEHGKQALLNHKNGEMDAGIQAISLMETASMQVIARLENLAQAGESNSHILCTDEMH